MTRHGVQYFVARKQSEHDAEAEDENWLDERKPSAHLVTYACVRTTPSVPARCKNTHCGEWVFGEQCQRCGALPIS